MPAEIRKKTPAWNPIGPRKLTVSGNEGLRNGSNHRHPYFDHRRPLHPVLLHPYWRQTRRAFSRASWNRNWGKECLPNCSTAPGPRYLFRSFRNGTRRSASRYTNGSAPNLKQTTGPARRMLQFRCSREGNARLTGPRQNSGRADPFEAAGAWSLITRFGCAGEWCPVAPRRDQIPGNPGCSSDRGFPGDAGRTPRSIPRRWRCCAIPTDRL